MSASWIGERQASAQSLSSPWASRDIGGPAVAGSASDSSGTFSIAASGADIWGTSDQFHFVYQPIAGDTEIIARVDLITQAHRWSKTGVMIRSSLNANAAHALALVSAGNGLALQSRRTVGGKSLHLGGAQGAAPRWVRLVRVGTTVTASYSGDGTSWTTAGSVTVALGTTAYVGLAATSHAGSRLTQARLSQVRVESESAGGPLPAPLQSGDIGGPVAAGRASHSSGTYRVFGAGADIWDTSDQFHFVYQAMIGDLDVRVRVASLQNIDPWSKAGVMVRESLTGGSRHAVALATAGNGFAFQRRVETDGLSDHTSGGWGSAPGWVRLVRTGTVFEAFRSADGQAWTSMGTDAIPMSDTVYVGIAVTSHQTGTLAEGVFDNLSMSASDPAPNEPPTVSLTSPSAGATYTAPASIDLSASASDADDQVARVEFFAGNSLIGTDTTAPYAATWASAPAGTHVLSAYAYDDRGASTRSATVSVTVNSAANQPPTVSLSSPASGATFTAPASITVSATASDPEGAMARVDFFANGAQIGTDSSSPYSVSWTGVAAGAYSITAVARDAAGNTTTSAAMSVTVNPAANQPPTVSLSSPASGATFTAPASITVSATASDPEGAMARVDFFANGAQIGTDSSSPYSVSWTGVAAGTYSLTAVARDTAGATRTSTAVSITVAAAPQPPPRYAVFVASTDHAVVTRYVLEIFAAGANPATATPVASSDLARPTPNGSNEITVDRGAFFTALAVGNYIATVRAENANGFTRSVAVSVSR